MNIIVFIHKNTSTLDYIVPALCKLAVKDKNTSIRVVYGCINKKSILRDSTFYSNIFKQHQMEDLDYSDISKNFLLNFFKSLFKNSKADAPSLEEIKKSKNLHDLLNYINVKLFAAIEHFICSLSFNFYEYLLKTDTQIILYESRSKSSFPLKKQFYKYLKIQRPQVVLLPHAPHYINEVEGYSPPFDGENTLSENFSYWMPFLHSKPWMNDENLRRKFVYTGYPAFDTEWIELYKNKKNKKEIRLLFIGRKFFPKGVKRWNKRDYVTLEYDDVLSSLNLIKQSIHELGADLILIFKAHPSSRKDLIQVVIEESGIKNYEITYEPFYSTLWNVNLVVSHYSTSVLIPIFYNIPVVLINSELQKFINSKWIFVNEMYSSFKYLSNSDIEIKNNIQSIIKNDLDAKEDLQNLRAFFPDGASERIIQNLNTLAKINEKKPSD